MTKTIALILCAFAIACSPPPEERQSHRRIVDVPEQQKTSGRMLVELICGFGNTEIRRELEVEKFEWLASSNNSAYIIQTTSGRYLFPVANCMYHEIRKIK